MEPSAAVYRWRQGWWDSWVQMLFAGSGGDIVEHAGAASSSGLGSLRGGRFRRAGGGRDDLRRGYFHGAQAFEEAGEGGGGVFFHGLTMATGGDGEYVVLRGGDVYRLYGIHAVNISPR